jgi:cellulose synthase/poly-beta-1,6-N-acetylglucosamine synthase-like glycosyltransferase
MTMIAWLAPVVGLLLFPVLWIGLEMVGPIRAWAGGKGLAAGEPVDDFEVLVPIYGSVAYLENVDFLRSYGSRVVLCTTRQESPTFDAELTALAAQHGFRIFRGDVGDQAPSSGQRRTSGTIRDRLVRDALIVEVRAPYVVCIDADTATNRPLDELVGALVANDFDFASVPLVPANTSTALGRLQAYEYRGAMLLRRLAPWQVSGACHVGRSEVHREIMRRHSLFFQGNDVEAGLLGEQLGYRVGHIPFEVPTTVPDRIRPWLRQRLAWAGGEFRLFVVNGQLVRRHPFFWLYGGPVVLAGAPWRWWSLATAGWVFATVLAVYAALNTCLHWRHRSWWLLALPVYSLFSSLVLAPLGALWYVKMAVTDRNAGLIRVGLRRRRGDTGRVDERADRCAPSLATSAAPAAP